MRHEDFGFLSSMMETAGLGSVLPMSQTSSISAGLQMPGRLSIHCTCSPSDRLLPHVSLVIGTSNKVAL